MPGNATGMEWVDFFIDNGIAKAAVKPYTDAFGDYGLLFYGVLVSGIMGMSYIRSNDVYQPLLLLMVMGAGASEFMPPGLKVIGNLSIALAITGLFVRTYWDKKR